MSGMQAMAAATFEGKPVEVDVVLSSGSGLDGGGGWVGSTGSGMAYIHKLGNVLSSNLPQSARFRFHSALGTNMVTVLTDQLND